MEAGRLCSKCAVLIKLYYYYLNYHLPSLQVTQIFRLTINHLPKISEWLKWLKLPGWGLENGPSLACVTPKHRKTKILATIPLKGKTEQRDLSLHVPLEVSDPIPLLERRPRRAAAPRVRGALRPDRCTSRLQINGLFAGATDTYHFAFIENVFHSRSNSRPFMCQTLQNRTQKALWKLFCNSHLWVQNVGASWKWKWLLFDRCNSVILVAGKEQKQPRNENSK